MFVPLNNDVVVKIVVLRGDQSKTKINMFAGHIDITISQISAIYTNEYDFFIE